MGEFLDFERVIEERRAGIESGFHFRKLLEEEFLLFCELRQEGQDLRATPEEAERRAKRRFERTAAIMIGPQTAAIPVRFVRDVDIGKDDRQKFLLAAVAKQPATKPRIIR